MRRILQEDPTGCGIACAAMVSGVSYAQAKQRAIELGIVEVKPPHRTQSATLTKLLEDLGVRCKKGRRLSHWSSLTTMSIVGINYKEKNDTSYWHWVVYVPDDVRGYVPDDVRGYVLDPRKIIKTEQRRDFKKMHPHNFIPVVCPNISLHALADGRA